MRHSRPPRKPEYRPVLSAARETLVRRNHFNAAGHFFRVVTCTLARDRIGCGPRRGGIQQAKQPAMSDTSKPTGVQGFARYCPGLGLVRDYKREWLAGDVVAGISVCVVLIPTAIAYSGLMGVAPQHGLYVALVSLVAYAIFGSSPQMIVGPDIALSLLIVSAIGPLAGGDPERAAALAATVALLSGVLLLLGARAKLGAVADFLSKPVLVGYMTGAALILMGSQLDKMFGVPLENKDFFLRLVELARKAGQTQLPTFFLGLGLLALLMGLRRFAPRVPGALVACVLGIGVSAAFGLEARGVAVVGTFPHGLPGFAWPGLAWHDAHSLLPAAIGVALLTYTEGILLARAFAAKNGYEVRANRELNALGLADVAAGLFQGFSVTGSQSATTVNDAAGGKTQLSSLVAAATLSLFLLFLTPLIAHLPRVALAAILINAGFSLVEFGVMARIYRYYPRSALIAALTTLSVLAAGVVPGILFGVALSLLGLIDHISNPPDAVLTEVPGHGFHDLGNTAGQTLPGLVVYRFYAPLLFSNVGHLVQRVRELVSAGPTPVRWFLLDAQAITDIDVTAVEELGSLRAELARKGVELKVAHVNRPLRGLLDRTGLAGEIGSHCFFDSVHDCVAAFQTARGASAGGAEPATTRKV
jgi:SulP family sulfate permease